MHMKKRGMIDLVYIVMAVAVILVGTLFYTEFSVGTKDLDKVESCRLSVYQNSQYRTGNVFKSLTGLDAPTPEIAAIDCPKRDLVINNKLVDKYKQGPEFGAKYEIATAMKTCKYQWGDFQLNPFSTDWFSGNKKFCGICYVVSFDDKFTLKGQKLGNFMQFLSSNYVSDGSKTFANYLTNTNYSWEIPSTVSGQSIDSIDTNKNYVVMYNINKKGFIVGSMSAIGGAGVGCALGSFLPIVGTAIGCGLGFMAGGIGGYVIGSPTLDEEQAIWFIPTESIRDRECDILYQ